MIERYFKVKNFRNIGIEGFESLHLNHILSKDDKMGDLVTLIGMNNSGKSNYLDAIMHLFTKQLKDTDKPIFNYQSESPTIVSMWIDDRNDSTKYEYTFKDGKTYVDKYVNNAKVVLGDEETTMTTESEDNRQKLSIFTKDDLENIGSLVIASNSQMIRDSYSYFLNNGYKKEHLEVVYNHFTTPQYIRRYEQVIEKDYYNYLIFKMQRFLGLQTNQFDGDLIIISEEINEKYNIKFIPNIIKYDETKTIKDIDTVLVVQEGKVNSNEFFKLVFSYLDSISYSSIVDIYEKFHQSNKIAKFHLTNFEKDANKELEKLSDKFNKIYNFNNKVQYTFRFVMESERTYFVLSEGDKDVPLDAQSTGFKWFFNFFFNVFANDKISNGDIVILDEPATNLHVLGQQELRKQIKEFGIRNGITFVVSTHSPFLIDTDYLDEVRLVIKDGMHSRLYNDMTKDDNGDNNVDTILPVYSALTVDKHIILNPNNTLVFVEGITDYNYLVAFKKLFGINDINFLPFQGTKSKNLIVNLLKMSSNPVILVDSDKAGKEFIKNHETNIALEIHQLNHVNESWKEIEDLFSAQDRKEFSIDEKKSHISSYLKSHIEVVSEKLTKKTRDNFKSLLDYLKR